MVESLKIIPAFVEVRRVEVGCVHDVAFSSVSEKHPVIWAAEGDVFSGKGLKIGYCFCCCWRWLKLLNVAEVG